MPLLPHRIGLITGRDSDAKKDVLRNAALRWPAVEFEIREVAVQGNTAVAQMIAALRELDAHPEVDVIVIARGGGALEDLLPFSSEELIRAVADASTPVVSAIGHEADRPILDDVADLGPQRPPTPRSGSSRTSPRSSSGSGRPGTSSGAASPGWWNARRDRLASLRSRPVLLSPDVMVSQRHDDVERLKVRSHSAISAAVVRAADQLVHLKAQVRALSPQKTLDRGYAVVQLADAGNGPRQRAGTLCGTRPRRPPARTSPSAWPAAGSPRSPPAARNRPRNNPADLATHQQPHGHPSAPQTGTTVDTDASPRPNRDNQGAPTWQQKPSPNADIEALSYEDAREQLVAVVGKLEAGGASLEESLALWERGEALAKRCEQWLEGARKRLAAARDQAADKTRNRHAAAAGSAVRSARPVPVPYRRRTPEPATAASALPGRPAAAAGQRCGRTTSCWPARRTRARCSVAVFSNAFWYASM